MSAARDARARHRRAWLRRAVQAGLMTGLAIDTVGMRRRAAALRILGADPGPAESAHRLVSATGVRLDPQTVAAARAHAHAQRLAVLDLVPGDLPVAQALDLLRDVDPATYRGDRFAAGRGANHAALVDEAVLAAAGSDRGEAATDARWFATTIAAVKLVAPAGTDLAIAPRLEAAEDVVFQAPQIIAALHVDYTDLWLAPRALWISAMLASSAFGRGWAAAMLGAWSAQPLAIFGGPGGLKPRDLYSYSAARLRAEPRHLLAVHRAARRLQAAAEDPVATRRPAYQEELAHGTDRFFEPRRTSCPWCQATDTSVRLRTTDLLQHKPGRFTLERCRQCGHVFQNPRLNPEGLSFYYRDAYDGLNETLMAALFGAGAQRYRASAAALETIATPHTWLDVGAGYGHFCNMARETWPDTEFDGLDIGSGIELAQRRGWIRKAHKGGFVGLAPDLAGTYDVVSMFHYLEHTPEPDSELEAARTALRRGGHLLIELPDPESRWAALLGRWWMPWLQPQHLHLIPAGNLRQRLEELGFAIVLEPHADQTDQRDLLAASMLATNHAAPRPDVPWAPHPPRRLSQVGRAGVFAAAIPVLVGAGICDRLIEPFGAKLGLPSAYRILARKL